MDMLTIAKRYRRVLIPLTLLVAKARVEILPMVEALVKGPEITSKASLKWNERSFIIARVVFFARVRTFDIPVEIGVWESGAIFNSAFHANGKERPSHSTVLSLSWFFNRKVKLSPSISYIS